MSDPALNQVGLEAARLALFAKYNEAMAEGKQLGSGSDMADAAIRAYLSALAPKPAIPGGWRTMDTAPKDGTTVLIGKFQADGSWVAKAAWWDAEFENTWVWDDEDAGDGHTEYAGAWTDGAVKSWGYEENMSYDPTHWQPLPASPHPSEEKP